MNTEVSRRELLLGATGMAAAWGAGRPRPNILWLMTDEHRADAMHCAGHPVVSTPNPTHTASHEWAMELVTDPSSGCRPR